MISVILAAIEVGLLGVLVITAIDSEIFRDALSSRGPVLHLGEMHHAYLGALLVVAGWWLGWKVMGLGVALTLDDVYQHARQTFRAEPEYRSPLHRLFAATLWRLRWVRDLSKWLDKRL